MNARILRYAGMKAALARKTGNVSTVSYTHLRAHETVLDLVCRLLLEKNQNHHKQHAFNKTNIR